MSKKELEIFKLKNGVEVLLIPKEESLTTTVMATVKVGSKYEEKNISGISHFLEHMAFKGTKNRPDPRDVVSELEGLGASYNATTSQERTNYYAKVRNKHFDETLDIISDLYLNPTVPEEELEKERGVILEEINMYEDLPMRKIYYLFLETIYGDQPAGWPVLGEKDVIKKIKREDFINYRNKHYKSEDTIITISGGFSRKNIKKKIEEAFSSLENEKGMDLPSVSEDQKEPRESVEFKKSDQAHLALGFRAFDIHDDRKYALEVLMDILGGGMSSRLFNEIREKRGLAYYIRAGEHLYTNNGFAAARAGVNKDKIEDAIEIILKEFQKVKEETIDKKELDKAKEHIIGSMFIGLETSSSLANFYTSQRVKELDPLSPIEIAEKVSKVTPEDIKSVANDLFTNENLNLAVIGPFKDKSFGDILQID